LIFGKNEKRKGKDEDECVVDGINEEWRIGVEL
jgi:hypothetical protein